ncbi:OmpH family outer membrane protein [Pelagibacteraceae bacterium]|nr:OmpH family outer membrane protein [Pelagibacteraceae bacterium]
MKLFVKNTFVFIILFFLCSQGSYAETTHFIDFSKVLNKSTAGADAQKKLKDKLTSEVKKFNTQASDLKKEEREIISQKKILVKEEYRKKVEALRKKVAKHQKDRKISFDNIAKLKSNSKEQLLKSVNPIVKKYMEDNKIRLVVEKNSVMMGDTSLEITDQIIVILNKEITSLKLN